MWRWTARILAGLISLLIVAATGGAAYQWIATRRDLGATSPPGSLVDIGGYRLHIWCMGSGKPTVILDSGLGGGAFNWPRIQPEVAKFTEVCAYDRAGLGYSDPGPRPRTSGQIAKELAKLIERGGIDGRVILVGASFGGFNTRIVASEYPERVAGLVLVDAPHETQGERFAAVGLEQNVPWVLKLVTKSASFGFLRLRNETLGLSPESADPSVRDFVRATAHRASRYETTYDELIHMRESAAQVGATRRELDIPLIVLSAGIGSGRGAEIHRELQRDQATLSSRACQVIAERSDHVITGHQPELVVEAIRAVTDAAKGKSHKPGC